MKQRIAYRLQSLIDSFLDPTSPLKAGIEHVLLSSGKLLRPQILLLLTQEHPLALDVACALEMLHVSSLIHDDLPCMDDDAFRRGKPTLHILYDEAHAVLSGDLLMTWPYRILSEITGLRDKQKSSLTAILSTRFAEVIEGQKYDLSLKSITINDLRKINRLKTAALFMAAFECAAIINEEPLCDYSIQGERFGLAYQAYDDLLDEGPSLQLLGEELLLQEIASLSQAVFHRFPLLTSINPFKKELAYS